MSTDVSRWIVRQVFYPSSRCAQILLSVTMIGVVLIPQLKSLLALWRPR
jgi:hypothetical protein